MGTPIKIYAIIIQIELKNSSLIGFSCFIKKPNHITKGMIAVSAKTNKTLLKVGLTEEIALKKIFLIDFFNYRILINIIIYIRILIFLKPNFLKILLQQIYLNKNK